MYVLTVIPITNRPLPGTLSYYSEKAYSRGALITVPVGKTDLPALVARCQTLSAAKSLIRNADYAIKKTPPVDPLLDLPEAFLEALAITSETYLAPPHHIAHTLFLDSLQKYIEENKTLPISKKIHIYPTWRQASFAATHGGHAGAALLHSGLTAKQQEKILQVEHDNLVTTPAFAWLYIVSGAEASLHESQHEHYYRARGPWFDHSFFLRELVSQLGGALEEPGVEICIDTKKLTPLPAPLKDKLGYAIVIHPSILKHIHSLAIKGEKILIISPRTGFASGVRCRDCGTIAHDEATGDRFSVVEKEPGLFVYQNNHKETSAAHTCQKCGGTNIVMFGFGTAAFDKILSRNFSSFDYHHITKTTGKRKLKEADTSSSGLVLGTWSALSHLTPDSYHTVVLGLEFLFGIPGVYQLDQVLHQVAVSTKRSKTVAIAQHDKDHPTLSSLFDASWKSMQKAEHSLRKQLLYPPHGVSALLSATIRRGASANLKHQIAKVLEGKTWNWYVRPSRAYTEEAWLTLSVSNNEEMRFLIGKVAHLLPEADIRINPRSI